MIFLLVFFLQQFQPQFGSQMAVLVLELSTVQNLLQRRGNILCSGGSLYVETTTAEGPGNIP